MGAVAYRKLLYHFLIFLTKGMRMPLYCISGHPLLFALFPNYTIFLYASAHLKSEVETAPFCFDIIPYFCALQCTWNQKSKQRLSVSILYRIKSRTDEKNALTFHLFCRSYICKRLHGNDCKLIASVIKLFISAVCKCKVHISRAVRVYFIHS